MRIVLFIPVLLCPFAFCNPVLNEGRAAASFSNPVIYEDYPDNDISVGPDGLFYYSASNFHFSPGAPILRSADLVNWELIGHSVPILDFGSNYNLDGGQAYRGGTWASTLRYRPSNGLWYWIGCIGFWNTYIYTSPSVTGPWKQSGMLAGGNCYYDCGLLIDDDDSMYVAYGNPDISVALLAADGLNQNKSQHVFSASNVGASNIEGNRMYKRNGLYYILDDDPSGSRTYIWKSTGPFGPYTSKIFIDSTTSPIPGTGPPIQGSLIEISTGAWYFMSFAWSFPNGRIPVLAPITWGSDGYPVLTTDTNGGWATSYPLPLPAKTTTNWTGTDTFRGTSLGPMWEWNHNPDTTKYKVNNGLFLSTATVTTDLFAARNTLTHRIHGEYPVGTVAIDFTNMADGDRVGLAAFRDNSASIGVYRVGNSYSIRMVHNMTQSQDTWATTSNGTFGATALITGKKAWFRVSMDSRAIGTGQASFSYSTDGAAFTQLGSYAMDKSFQLFVGYRFGIFNYAAKALGGSVAVSSFTTS